MALALKVSPGGLHRHEAREGRRAPLGCELLPRTTMKPRVSTSSNRARGASASFSLRRCAAARCTAASSRRRRRRSNIASIVRRSRRATQESFFVIEAESDALAGVVNINDIVRHSRAVRPARLLRVRASAGKGLMRDGLEARRRRARFATSACTGSKPTSNAATCARSRSSKALGFAREGTARGFLKIGNSLARPRTVGAAERGVAPQSVISRSARARMRAAVPSCRRLSAARTTSARRSRRRYA